MPFHGATTAVRHTHGCHGFEQGRIIRQVGPRQGQLQQPTRICASTLSIAALGCKGRVVAAKAVAGKAVDGRAALDLNIALDHQIRPRRAKEVLRIDRQCCGCAQVEPVAVCCQRDVDAVGDEILDQHGLGGKGRGVHIALHFDPPCAARDVWRQRQGHHMAAGLTHCADRAAVFHPVRAAEDHR